MNVLVLCTGNSARSILLESVLNTNGNGRLQAWSAGSCPTGKVHPEALELLAREGHDTSNLRSKSWDEFAASHAPQMDIVITVCGNAANESCPVWPGAPVRAHWGVEDPAAAAPDVQKKAFEDAYARLSDRAREFLKLPLEDMDRTELIDELARIGKQVASK